MPSILIAGASRGIGKGIAEHYAAAGYDVIATMRKPDESLGSKVKVLKMDVTREESVAAAAKEVQSLDILVVNAAVGELDSMLECSASQLDKMLQTNVVGAHRVVAHFINALKQGKEKKLVIMSSSAGSLEQNLGSPVVIGAYAVTKAAANMLTVQYHNELLKESSGFKVIAIHPGHVDTDMASNPDTIAKIGKAAISVKESVEGMSKVIDNLTAEQSGKVWTWEGKVQPW